MFEELLEDVVIAVLEELFDQPHGQASAENLPLNIINNNRRNNMLGLIAPVVIGAVLEELFD